MERVKLEEYKDATGIALLNAYSAGLLSKKEYQLIQQFKRNSKKDIDEFLRTVKNNEKNDESIKESTNIVESTNNVESTNIVESDPTNNVESTNIVWSTNTIESDATNIVESTKNVESTNIVGSIPVRKVLKTEAYNETNKAFESLSYVKIKNNFTKLDNEVSDYLNKQQTPLEQSIYNRLYRLSIGWGKNHCRISSEALLTACNIKDRRTLNNGIDGLIEKGHIQVINRNNNGVLYRILLPQEVLINESNTDIELIPINRQMSEDNSQIEYTKNVESTKNVDSTKITHIKDNRSKDNIKDTLSQDQIIDLFYKSIGQTKISKVKRERAKKCFEELIQDGFTNDDIQFAIEWSLKNMKEKPYDFSIIKDTISQAMAQKDKIQKEQKLQIEKEISKTQKEEQDEKEAIERENIIAIKQNLSSTERSELRSRALELIRNTEGIKENFITEVLIEAKENEMLRLELCEQK